MEVFLWSRLVLMHSADMANFDQSHDHSQMANFVETLALLRSSVHIIVLTQIISKLLLFIALSMVTPIFTA